MEAAGQVVVADFEAGLGTLSRIEAGQIDRILVIAEPTMKSLEVARRALEMIESHGAARVHVVANRIADEDDRRVVLEILSRRQVTLIPEDPAIREAERWGAVPFEAAGDAPAVLAVQRIANAMIDEIVPG